MFQRFSVEKYLPYPSRQLIIDGQRLRYIDTGAGDSKPCVMLLHGNPTWSFYYRNLIAALSPSSRVIAPDFIGCGLSDHPTDHHYRAADRVQHLERLLDEIKVDKFSLVMHDWGGPIGTSLAVRHASKVQRLVYLNTTLTETESLPAIIKVAASPMIGKTLTKTTKRFLKLMTDFGVAKRLPAEVKRGYLHPYRTSARRTAIWDFVADIPFSHDHPSYSQMMEMAEKLPSLKNHPVLIIWGLKDPCFHRAMLKQVAGHFPKAKVIEIPNASHLVLEDATTLACDEIERFMNETASPQGSRPAAGNSNSLYREFAKHCSLSPAQDAVILPQRSISSFLPEPFGLTGAAGVFSYHHINYAALGALVNQYQRGLVETGLRPGQRVLMLVPPGLDFLALAFAVMGRGAVPVFVDPGVGIEQLQRCISDCAADMMIGSPKAHVLRFLKKEAFKTIRIKIVASDWFPGGHNLGFLKRFSATPLEEQPVSDSAPGLIAFTSGATGTPKGVIFTNAMLAEQLRIFREDFGITPGKRDLPLLPIFSLFNLAAGICSVFPPIDSAKPLELDPGAIVKIIEDLSVSYSFGSPTLWNKIGQYCLRRQLLLPSLEKVLMAGASVSRAVLELVRSVAKNASVCTPYGATEALPVTLADSDFLLSHPNVSALTGEQGTLVGKPLPSLQVRIVESAEGSISEISETTGLPARQIGEILVKGKNISPAYLNRPDANKSHKVKDGLDFWHRIGDVGYFDENEALYYCGRKAHVVRANGQTYYSVPLESIFDLHPKVRRSALVSLHSGRGAAIVIEPKPEHFPDTPEKQDMFAGDLRALAKSNPLTESIEFFFFHPSFPVDARHNAKIFRDKLGDWASKLPAGSRA